MVGRNFTCDFLSNVTLTDLETFPQYWAGGLSSVHLVFSMGSVGGLTALLSTVALADELNRHPLYINVLISCLLFAGTQAYKGLVLMAYLNMYPGRISASDLYSMSEEVLEHMLWISMQLSTLCLLIFLCFIFASIPIQGEKKAMERRKRWVAILLLLPYFAGAVLVLGLLNPYYGEMATSILEAILVCITIGLLFKAVKGRHAFRKTALPEVWSLGLLLKLLVFCVYRFVFIIIDLMSYTHKDDLKLKAAVGISRTVYPLLAFVVFGLFAKDVRAIWFPSRFTSEAHFNAEIPLSKPQDGYGVMENTGVKREDP